MTAFDKAWGVVKTRGFDIRDHNGEEDEDAMEERIYARADPILEILMNDIGVIETEYHQADEDADPNEYEAVAHETYFGNVSFTIMRNGDVAPGYFEGGTPFTPQTAKEYNKKMKKDETESLSREPDPWGNTEYETPGDYYY